MASLPSLLQELIHQISEDLSDQDDLLSLRLTCSSLNHKLHSLHLTSIYKTRRTSFVPRSLHNLLKIASDPSGIGNRIEYLKIADSNPYREIVSWPASESDSEVTVLRREAREKLTAAGRPFRREAEEMIREEKDIEVLVEIFKRMEGLKEIEIEKSSELPTRWELNLLYPSLGLHPGARTPEYISLLKNNDRSRGV